MMAWILRHGHESLKKFGISAGFYRSPVIHPHRFPLRQAVAVLGYRQQ
jgi:hypothetical protein